MIRTWCTAVSCTVLLALGACSRSTETIAPAPAPAGVQPTLEELQGRWSAASGTAQTVLVLPPAQSAAPLWALSADGRTLSRMTLSYDGTTVSAQGRAYALGDGTAQAASWSGSAEAGPVLRLDGGALVLQRQDRLDAVVALGDVAGSWQASFAGGAVRAQLTLDAGGAITGISTTGCTYAGQVTTRGGTGVLDATLAETCAGTTRSYAGIASYQPADGAQAAALTLAGTTADGSQALLLAMAR